MIIHDPSEYIRGIQQILISDKKRIGFLFGAGSSLSRKSEKSLTVPAIGQMTTEIVKTVGEVEGKYKTALEEIKKELSEQNFNIETILTNLEQKASFIGGGTLNTLIKDDFKNLIVEIKRMLEKWLVFTKLTTLKLQLKIL